MPRPTENDALIDFRSRPSVLGHGASSKSAGMDFYFYYFPVCLATMLYLSTSACCLHNTSFQII